MPYDHAAEEQDREARAEAATPGEPEANNQTTITAPTVAQTEGTK